MDTNRHIYIYPPSSSSFLSIVNLFFFFLEIDSIQSIYSFREKDIFIVFENILEKLYFQFQIWSKFLLSIQSIYSFREKEILIVSENISEKFSKNCNSNFKCDSNFYFSSNLFIHSKKNFNHVWKYSRKFVIPISNLIQNTFQLLFSIIFHYPIYLLIQRKKNFNLKIFSKIKSDPNFYFPIYLLVQRKRNVSFHSSKRKVSILIVSENTLEKL